MKISFKKVIVPLLLAPHLAFAQADDSTGSSRLNGVSENFTRTVATATATANSIQEWLNANAGKRFVLPSNYYPMSLYVTSSAACIQYHYNGYWQAYPSWQAYGSSAGYYGPGTGGNNNNFCFSPAFPELVGNCEMSVAGGIGSVTRTGYMRLTAYGFIGANAYAPMQQYCQDATNFSVSSYSPTY